MPYIGNKIGEIRPNQLVTTFGPGSIIDAVKDSVTILDTNYWKELGKKIIDGRMAAYLGVSCFYMPKTSKFGDLPIVSFPYYHVCSSCGRLFDVRQEFNPEKYLIFGPTCPDCHSKAYPARFISMCRKGHLDDFPWSWWVHRGDETKCKGHRLRLYSIGYTSTLSDLWVECLDCGAKRSMSGAMQPENFIGKKCSGHHPFRPTVRNERCVENIIPSQRGASNVYFPVIRSAISIPPWTNPLYNLIDEHLRMIEDMKSMGVDDAEEKVYKKYFADNYSKEEFDKALEKRRQNIKEFVEIKRMEYEAITHHNDPAYASNKKHFNAEEETVSDSLKKYFGRIIRITRLRDVMVLLGFTRVDAPDPDADEQINIVHLNKTTREPWLPAVEVNGEGIFIEFNKKTIQDWLKIPDVNKSSKLYEECYEKYCESRNWENIISRNAKYVLLHTLSHILIKEMGLLSGYSSSAIKERIYSNEDMAGILLYTGSSDKEGSLGGLVELGKTSKLLKIIRKAFENALICTNDPECMSNLATVDRLNGAACHACCMISETACENGNRLLDRAFIVPLAGREEEAFFRELVRELCHLEV